MARYANAPEITVKPSVYIETSFVSYLTARPSRDLVMAARQQTTREWWDVERAHFDLFTSELVIVEASAGDPVAAAERLDILNALPNLAVTEARRNLPTP